MSTQTFYNQWDGSKKQSIDSYVANADEITSLTKFGIQTVAISVGLAAVELTTNLSHRRTVIIQNNDLTLNLFIGGSAVTTLDGISIAPGVIIEIAATNNIKIYGISAGTIDVRCLESG